MHKFCLCGIYFESKKHQLCSRCRKLERKHQHRTKKIVQSILKLRP